MTCIESPNEKAFNSAGMPASAIAFSDTVADEVEKGTP
jgi:hypothetical protein